MNYFITIGFIATLLMSILIGICGAEETPIYAGYIQGGDCSLTYGIDGKTIITIRDIIPFYFIDKKNQGNFFPIEMISWLNVPFNSALVIKTEDNESTFMIEITNISLSDHNNVITLEVKPLKFYDGEILKPFIEEKQDKLDIQNGTILKSGLCFEQNRDTIFNSQSLEPGSSFCDEYARNACKNDNSCYEKYYSNCMSYDS